MDRSRTPWNGVLFANEVIDALPTPRFTIRDGEVFEEYVALDGEGRFRAHATGPADPMLAAAVRHVERQLPAPFAEGYRSEAAGAAAVLAAGGDGRHGAMARCCSSTTAMHAASTTSRSAATAPCARSAGTTCAHDVFALAGSAGHHRFGGLHRAGRSRRERRLRVRRLLLAGQLPDRQPPAGKPGAGGIARGATTSRATDCASR